MAKNAEKTRRWTGRKPGPKVSWALTIVLSNRKRTIATPGNADDSGYPQYWSAMLHGMVDYSHFVRISALIRGTSDGNCRAGARHGTVGPLFPGTRVIVRTVGHSLVLLLLALCVVQFIGTACSDDCLPEWSTNPVHAHDQLPGSPDGQTESDQGEGELEELALAQGEAIRIVHLMRSCVLDDTACPRTDFALDWFRPPVHP